MSKRRKYRYWSKEEKHRIIKRLFTEDIGVRELCRDEKITTALIYKWKAAYEEFGEQLQYENMKLKIENARLKKGYTNEEVVSIRQKKSSKKSMK